MTRGIPDSKLSSDESPPAMASVENIGGIDSCEVTFEPGVTLLVGRNATNRTSLLSAVAFGLGGSAATPKSDAETGHVELVIDDESYTRECERRNGTVSTDGTPYTEDEQFVDLFVSLLEDNPARQTVERGDELRDVIMRPVDTEKIRTEIRDREEERDRIDRRIEELEQQRDRIPALEERRVDRRDRLETVEETLKEARQTAESHDADEGEAEMAEELVDKLEGLRDDRREIDSRLERQQNELEQLRQDRTDLEAELDDITVPGEELEEIEGQIEELKGRKRDLETSIDDLLRVVEFNDELLSGNGSDLPGVNVGGDTTARLDPSSETVECWTCGSQVVRGDIVDRLDGLREIVTERRERQKKLKADLEALRERRSDFQNTVERKDELTDSIEKTEREIIHRESTLEELEEDRERLTDEIEEVEDRVDETQQLRDSELVAAYRQVSELEYKRGRLENELEEIEEELEQLDSHGEDLDQLRDQRNTVTDELSSLRSRIDDLERAAVDEFNDQMEEVLDLLGYENLTRVWIERKVDSPKDTSFELHVIRETEGGEVYEDVVDNLSESEREVVGLVVALAGHRVHDVHEMVPMILLDSLEAVDAERIAALLEYFADFVPYLIVALLPQVEETMPSEWGRITPAELSP